jgi:hypothetical protein
MDTVLRFPDPAEEARMRSEEFQCLPTDERFRQLAALMAFGWRMVRSCPNPQAAEQRLDEQEERWRQIQRELFARHGR